jgi:hypothetical protein
MAEQPPELGLGGLSTATSYQSSAPPGPSTREISAATLRHILALRIVNTVELWCHESRCIHDEQPIVLQFCRLVTEFSHALNNGFVPRFYEPGRMITMD